MTKNLISTIFLVLFFGLVYNAQNTSTKLLKSDTSWLTTKQLFIGTFYYDSYPNDGSQKKATFIGFSGTAKIVDALDRKMGYYYEKSPEAYSLYKKGRNLKTAGNIAIITPLPIVLLAKQSSTNNEFWVENTGPIIAYGVASAIIFLVLRKIAYKSAIKAVPIYNKTFKSSPELHKY